MNRLGKNNRLLVILAACVALMIGVAYASVPLYRIFCKATGFAGTTQRVTFNPNGDPSDAQTPGSARTVSHPATRERWITVSFDSNVDSSLPWEFGPDQKTVRVKLGEVTNITYHAHNKGTAPVTGTATFNVQPDKIGSYFDKIQCFCFTKQTLQPDESVTLPVQFYIDPALADDSQADDVQNITLSYTFFRAKDQSDAHKPHDMSKMGMQKMDTPTAPPLTPTTPAPEKAP
jgi:cytochrome c oxidase assembly protein subunit 11